MLKNFGKIPGPVPAFIPPQIQLEARRAEDHDVDASVARHTEY